MLDIITVDSPLTDTPNSGHLPYNGHTAAFMRARRACKANARLSSLSAHTSYMQHVLTVCVSGKYSLGLISVIPMFHTNRSNNVNLD